MNGFDYENDTADPNFTRCRGAPQYKFRSSAFDTNPFDQLQDKRDAAPPTTTMVAVELHRRLRALADAIAEESQALQEEADALRVADIECALFTTNAVYRPPARSHATAFP